MYSEVICTAPESVSERDDARLGDIATASFAESVYRGIPMVWSHTPWLYVIRKTASGSIVSSLGLLVRSCLVGGQSVRVAGIGGVMTAPNHRGAGLASKLLRAAAADMRAVHAVDFGLLQCPEHRITFYQALGWTQAAVPMWHTQPDGVRHAVLETPMLLRLTDAPWPPGDIDMNGTPW
jgi:GNAT superfamily N-acetyltransferase